MSIETKLRQSGHLNIDTQGDFRLPDLGSGSITWDLGASSSLAEFYRRRGKRLFDLVAGSLLFVAILPLLVVLMALVAIDGGSPLFSHQRVGRNGKTFGCLKIRSMRLDAEERLAEILRTDAVAAKLWYSERKLVNDPRITPIGRFLRKSSLDELPQIWNVVRGEMSLVGPRPVTSDELSLYGAFQTCYASVRPGLTGHWQVSGRNDVSYEQRVSMDCEYVSGISLSSDMRILFATLGVVLIGTGR